MHACLLALTALLHCPALAIADEAENRAATIVEKLGRKVYRDKKAAHKPIIEVNLRGKPVTDADLKTLGTIKSLKALILNGTKVTDAGAGARRTFLPTSSRGCALPRRCARCSSTATVSRFSRRDETG